MKHIKNMEYCDSDIRHKGGNLKDGQCEGNDRKGRIFRRREFVFLRAETAIAV